MSDSSRRSLPRIVSFVVGLLLCPAACIAGDTAVSGAADERPDSFKYYGPGGMDRLWARDDWQPHRIGRDTWIHWTWGNQKFLRFGTLGLGNQPVPVSLDLYRLLDSRQRWTRFARLGLINEPNCQQATEPDQYGLWLDKFSGDPLHYYPTDPAYADQQRYPGTDQKVDTSNYGEPSGVVGIRLFKNPKFDPAKWDLKAYFENPGKVEPPHLVGFTCALCHIAFDPTKPPRDPERPRWENLAANIGNQYLREGDLIFTKGRILFGNTGKGPRYQEDPYDTTGLGPDTFLYHYAATQQPGTSETSRISYDFINNPNTMNAIFNLGHRRLFTEVNSWGKSLETMHILKDGADSVAVEWALMRVPINIGCEGVYWSDSLFNPFTGNRQHSFRIAEALWKLSPAEKQGITAKYGIQFDQVKPERIAELKSRYRDIDAYGHEFGTDWAEAWRRNGSLATYLVSYRPFELKTVSDGKHVSRDAAQLQRGKNLFADNCARCHSNKQPPADLVDPTARRDFFRSSVNSADFLVNNTLADDVRYSALELGTNLARSLATNAVEDDVWAEFSSRDYKLLPRISDNPIPLSVEVFPGQPPVNVAFRSPAAGRGYYRTPSLVSIWSTAPFLHNNSVGSYSGDPSVEGRLKDFEDGMQKLLSPEKRPMTIKRVGQECSLLPSLPGVLPALLTDRLIAELKTHLSDKLPRQLVDSLARDLKPLIAKKIEAKINSLTSVGQNILEIVGTDGVQGGELVAIVNNELTGLAQRAGIPNTVLQGFDAQLQARIQADLKTLHSMATANHLTIPAGTPINLYANLSLSSLPYAILAHLRFPKGSRELAEELLRLSDCPDLVEDHGHIYGRDLSAQEKRDLIEFLKTF